MYLYKLFFHKLIIIHKSIFISYKFKNKSFTEDPKKASWVVEGVWATSQY
jgi:hypothetical protein